MFVISLVLYLLVIQCGCHWSQLKRQLTYLLNSHQLKEEGVGKSKGIEGKGAEGKKKIIITHNWQSRCWQPLC